MGKSTLYIILGIFFATVFGLIFSRIFWFQPTAQLNLGVLAPISGENQAYGTNAVNAIQLAAEEISTQGGVFTGTRVTPVVEDSAAGADAVTAAVQKLANTDKAYALIKVMPPQKNDVEALKDTPFAAKFLAAYEKKFGQKPEFPAVAAAAYDAAMVATLGLQRAGEGSAAPAMAEGIKFAATPPGPATEMDSWFKIKTPVATGRDVDFVGLTDPLDFNDQGVSGRFKIETGDLATIVIN